VTGLAGPPQRATLELSAMTRSGRAGIDLWSAHDRPWHGRLTWRSAPRRTGHLRHLRPFRARRISVDLTDVVRGNGAYTFALTTRGRRGLRFASSESTPSRSPRLVLRVADEPSGPSRTRPPGAAPLADAAAAAHVRAVPEIRPGNAGANRTAPTAEQVGAFRSAFRAPYADLVTGSFTGTTGEIIQWAAWKWGIDEDVMRAVAVQESDWNQDAVNPDGATFGIFQIKTQLADHGGTPGTFPLARDSTPFNADYYARSLRSCYDGRETWVRNGYHSGDMWGCVRWWFSGGWHGPGAEDYVRRVQRWYAERPWERPGY
jgi:hypothetical protein